MAQEKCPIYKKPLLRSFRITVRLVCDVISISLWLLNLRMTGKLPTVYAVHKTVPSYHRKVRVWRQAIVLQVKFNCLQVTRKNIHYIYNHTMFPLGHITTRVWCQHHWTSHNTRKHFDSQLSPITPRLANHFYMLDRFFSSSYYFRLLVRTGAARLYCCYASKYIATFTVGHLKNAVFYRYAIYQC
jgi:hypothetical protein